MLLIKPPSFKNLRELVFSFEEDDWFVSNKENILFELNHLELHSLDGYLKYLYENGIRSQSNKPNSSIAYLVGITTIEPRGKVITKGGTTPDIDTDFEDTRREDLKTYLRDKYGTARVSNIGTFNVSKCKGLFKDCAKIFQLSFDEANEISKILADDADASIRKEVKENKKVIELIEKDAKLREIFDYACHIEGSIRGVGVHASGVAIANVDIDSIVPLFESSGEAVTMFDGETLEKLGIIKFDILGLNTLTLISKTIELIKKSKGIDIDIDNIDLDDQKVFDFYASGDLLGIFQVEKPGCLEFATAAKPHSLLDIGSIVALYRPGPMGMGALGMYLKRTANRSFDWKFEIPEYSHIFSETYGLLVYQEQLMQLAREMCGFTPAQTDELRKAVGKKDEPLFQKQKAIFVEGAVKHTGQDRERIDKLFESMKEFARYCFNKSHSICYAIISYQTAWLKTYYKKEFLAALISTEKDGDRKAQYIENARTNKIRVVPPDINKSVVDFTVGQEEEIFFGFSSIKGMGEKATQKILELQPFNSFADFLIRCHHAKGINKKVVEALVYCGSLDCFGYKKSVLLSGFASFIFDYVNSLKDANVMEPDVVKRFLDLEGEYFDNSIPELSFLDVLEKEKELLGIYLSASPFNFIKKNTKQKGFSGFDKISEQVNKTVNFLCRIEKAKPTITKAGKSMCFIDAIDESGMTQSFVVFEESYKRLQTKIKNQIYAILRVSIRAGKKEGSKLSLIVNDIIDLTEELTESIKKTEFKNAIRQVSLVFEGIPSTVRFKSIQSIINEYNKPDSNCKVNLIVKLNDKYKVNMGCMWVEKIDVNFLRAFARIKDVYVTRDT